MKKGSNVKALEARRIARAYLGLNGDGKKPLAFWWTGLKETLRTEGSGSCNGRSGLARAVMALGPAPTP
jgi:hypothetical protein